VSPRDPEEAWHQDSENPLLCDAITTQFLDEKGFSRRYQKALPSTMFALRKTTTSLSMLAKRRAYTNSAAGPVTPWINMLKSTPKEKALQNPLVPVRAVKLVAELSTSANGQSSLNFTLIALCFRSPCTNTTSEKLGLPTHPRIRCSRLWDLFAS